MTPMRLRFACFVLLGSLAAISGRAGADEPGFYIESSSITSTVDTTFSTTNCNFNGTAVPCPGWVWFMAVLKLKAPELAPVTVFLRNQHITFTASGVDYDLLVPNSATTFLPSGTTAITTFVGGEWATTVPVAASGNQFGAGLAWAVPCPSGLPRSVVVTWTAEFWADQPGASVDWTWSAAAYTNFTSSYNSLDIKATDSNQYLPDQNSLHAGTPQAYASFVTGGATGGGGSNFTGSLCSTKNVPSPTGARTTTWGRVKILYR